jgi:hypothetical protein
MDPRLVKGKRSMSDRLVNGPRQDDEQTERLVNGPRQDDEQSERLVNGPQETETDTDEDQKDAA